MTLPSDKSTDFSASAVTSASPLRPSRQPVFKRLDEKRFRPSPQARHPKKTSLFRETISLRTQKGATLRRRKPHIAFGRWPPPRRLRRPTGSRIEQGGPLHNAPGFRDHGYPLLLVLLCHLWTNAQLNGISMGWRWVPSVRQSYPLTPYTKSTRIWNHASTSFAREGSRWTLERYIIPSGFRNCSPTRIGMSSLHQAVQLKELSQVHNPV